MYYLYFPFQNLLFFYLVRYFLSLTHLRYQHFHFRLRIWSSFQILNVELFLTRVTSFFRVKQSCFSIDLLTCFCNRLQRNLLLTWMKILPSVFLIYLIRNLLIYYRHFYWIFCFYPLEICELKYFKYYTNQYIF